MSWGVVAVGVMGAGVVVRAIGRHEANQAEAEAEMANAAYYREQAQFAEDAGRRSQMIFDRETSVLLGEQQSALVASGAGETTMYNFMGQQALYREQESVAIQRDTEANVRLATLRSSMSSDRAAAADDGEGMALVGDILGAAGSFAGGQLAGKAKPGEGALGSPSSGSRASASMTSEGIGRNYRGSK